ncbi:chaplin [Streptomyces sp. NPDC002870]|uniref:chaplin n=1 Tax=Streptomyces sp. NPDC002870 TaxID=3364666 RepID=UPI0036AA078B
MRQVTRKGLITMAAAGGVLALGGSYAYADAGATGTASNSPGVASGNSVQLPLHAPVNACGNTVNVIGLLNPASGNGCGNTSGSGNSTPGGAQVGGETSSSPGIASGNNIQAPLDVPVNACGNTVTIGGLGNAVSGNECGNGTTSGTTPETPPGPPVTPPVVTPPVTPPGTPVTPPVVTPPVTPPVVTPPVTPPVVTPPVTPVTPPVTPVTPPVTPTTPGQPQTPAQPAEPAAPSTPNAPEPVAPAEPNAPGAQTGTLPGTPDELAQTGSGPLDMLVPAGAGLLLAGAVLYRRGRARA